MTNRLDIHQQLRRDTLLLATRRHFLRTCTTGLGSLWLASAFPGRHVRGAHQMRTASRPWVAGTPQSPAKAKRVIFLHMAGAPSQLELFDYKPELKRLDGEECPSDYLEGQRFAFISGVPRLLGPVFPFHQSGESGAWISDRLPHFEQVIDQVCMIRSLHSDQFNHAPAQLLMHTGNQNLGYPAIGSWTTYGLGTENENMPGYVVLLSGGRFPSAGKSAWGSGFLPSVYQGVQCRSHGDPVLFLSNPSGMNSQLRRHVIEALNKVNQRTYQEFGDPETVTRIAQYEMAFRMQMAASEAMDIEQEPAHIHQLYGTQPGQESFANNCLLARRLVERGVRFVQLFDWGWDSHGAAESEALNFGFKQKCVDIDRPMAGLLIDLKRRGLLDDTLVVWAGEFGRTPMRENRGGAVMKFIGRDHHPHAFTIWMAGGGVKVGFSYGETDDFGFAPTAKPMSMQSFHATLLYLLGMDHHELVYPFQGLNQKLTGVKPAEVVHDILA